MGIDPLTHKPLSTTDDQQPQVEINQQEQEPLMINDESIIDRNNKEPETSVQSSITEVNKEEDKVMSMTSSPLFDHIDAATMEIMNNNFCTDDVPLIEPHEILVPCSTSSRLVLHHPRVHVLQRIHPISCWKNGSFTILSGLLLLIIMATLI